MVNVAIGAILTALLGGLLVPWVKGNLDRRTERYTSSVALLDTLASSLWTYWKLALRVAYYGRQGQRSSEEFQFALRRWDGDDSWQVGCEIQIQVSKSKRLLPEAAHEKLDLAQQDVVDYLDRQIDRLRVAGTPETWEDLYVSLMTDKRSAIDELLASVTADLRIGDRPRRTQARPARSRS